MSSTPGNLKALLAGKATRRTRTRMLRPTTRGCSASARTSFNNGGGRKLASVKCSKVVSAKLETLKNLIPNGKSSGTANTGTKCTSTDDLFKETADYIVLLRTQVVLLQKLVEFYGSSSNEEENKPTAAVSS